MLARLVLLGFGIFACSGSPASSNGAAGSNDTMSLPDPAQLTPVATPIGALVGDAIAETIGPEGGSLATSDSRFTVEVPPGAVTEDTMFSIQPVTGTAPGARGSGYRLGPDGAQFEKPVTLTFRYSDADLSGTAAELLGLAFQSGDGYWHWVGDATVDAEAKAVTVTTDHFTDFDPVVGANLRPNRATVAPGDTLKLDLVFCYLQPLKIVQDADGSDLASLPALDCVDPDADPAPILVKGNASWEVDGTPGGSAKKGTIMRAGRSAVYTAPAQAPSPNKVSVAARLRFEGAEWLLISEVTIGNAIAKYTGSVGITGTYYTDNDTRTYTVEATELVTLELATSGQHGATFEAQRGANTGTINPAPLSVSAGSSSRHCTPSEALNRDVNAAGAHIDLSFDDSNYMFAGVVGWGGPYTCTYDDPDTLGGPTTDYGNIALFFGSCGPTVADPTAPYAPYTNPAHLSGSCDHPQSATHNLHIVWDLVGTP